MKLGDGGLRSKPTTLIGASYSVLLPAIFPTYALSCPLLLSSAIKRVLSVIPRLRKTSVCGQAKRGEDEHVESGSYGGV
jgi:hypothetical protein